MSSRAHRKAGLGREAAPGLDTEIDEWEHEQAQQQRAFNEELAAQERRLTTAAQEEVMIKEDAILERLFGQPRERPPTRWSKPARKLHFFAESEFLKRTPRLSETVFAQERAEPDSEPEAPRLQSSLAVARSILAQSPEAAKKPRTPALRRTRSSLQVISEVSEPPEFRGRESKAGQHRAEIIDRGLWSRGSQGSSRGSAISRPTSREPASAARAIFSAMKEFSPFTRSVTPQTPDVARKYGELSESNVRRLVGSASAERTPSRGGIIKNKSMYDHIDSRGLIHPLPRPQREGAERSSRGETADGNDDVSETPHAQVPPPEPGKKPTKVKVFDEKTGLWATGRDKLQEVYKDDKGHGTTIYPRLPQVFDDPAHAVADALLNAKNAEETKMVLDKIAMDLRPGSFAAGQVDFEASVGLVLTDDFHGVMVELIEANSSASECKDILRGDYILEVNNSDVLRRSADQVENMLMGKEGTTVSLVIQVISDSRQTRKYPCRQCTSLTFCVQTDQFAKPRTVSLMRKSLGAQLHTVDCSMTVKAVIPQIR
jgi:hypothetical protein